MHDHAGISSTTTSSSAVPLASISTTMIILFSLLLLAVCHCSSHIPHHENDPNLQPDSQSNSEQFTFFSKLSHAFSLLNHGKSTESPNLQTSPEQTTLIPFKFPLPRSYGLTTARTIGKMMGCDYEKVQCILVRMVCALVQFHVQRLFKLRNYKFAAPNRVKCVGKGWNANPDEWFHSLMTAFFPHTLLSWEGFFVPIQVKNIGFGPFEVVRGEARLNTLSSLGAQMLCLRLRVNS